MPELTPNKTIKQIEEGAQIAKFTSEITSQELEKLAKALESNTSLTSLDLSIRR